jgi:hypothetical protein
LGSIQYRGNVPHGYRPVTPKQVTAAEAFVARGAWVSHVVLVEAVWVLTFVKHRAFDAAQYEGRLDVLSAEAWRNSGGGE